MESFRYQSVVYGMMVYILYKLFVQIIKINGIYVTCLRACVRVCVCVCVCFVLPNVLVKYFSFIFA